MSVHLLTKPLVEAVAAFHDATKVDAVVEALKQAGFRNDALSLLAGEEAVGKKLGQRYERVEELEDDEGAPRVTYRPQADLDDSEDTTIGSLTFFARGHRCRHGRGVRRRGRGSGDRYRYCRCSDRDGSDPLAGSRAYRSPTGAAGAWRSAPLGQHTDRRPSRGVPLVS